eukprot:TRINITY_DN760_c0_g1_i2.p1 TRINITY_DN760_c0_g1~~TRINITY_DN760_c0_g1_i2.p1  ORF type:complete len:589 (-),score=140.98 TRINITY_DN760_c0_g1_i2:90-1658(-)
MGEQEQAAGEAQSIEREFACNVLAPCPVSGMDLRQQMLQAAAQSPQLPSFLHPGLPAAMWIRQIVHDYNVEVVLPQHAQLLAQYSRCKSHALLLNRKLGTSFFRMLGDTPMEIRISNKKMRHHQRLALLKEEQALQRKRRAAEAAEAAATEPPAIVVPGEELPERAVVISFTPDYITPQAKQSTEMTVTVSVTWREARKLTNEDIFRGFAKAKCFRPDSKEELCCEKCLNPGDSIIRVTPRECTSSTRGANQHDVVETYTFAVTSLCSSSMQHMNCSHVVLGFDLGPVRVFSSTPVRLRTRAPPATKLLSSSIGSGSPLEHSPRASPRPSPLFSSLPAPGFPSPLAPCTPSATACATPCGTPCTPASARQQQQLLCSVPPFTLTPESPDLHSSDDAFMAIPEICALPVLVPCVFVLVVQHNPALSKEQWRAFVDQVQESQLQSGSPLRCLKTTVLPDEFCTFPGLQSDHDQWTSVETALYAVPVEAVSEMAAHVLYLLGLDHADGEMPWQLSALFCNQALQS